VAELDLKRVLCRMEELAATGCREFRLGSGEWPLRGFVVRVGGEVRAYVNRCAHLAYPLNYMPDRFLTPDDSMIICYVHGALFEKGNGYCVAGPCSGLSLITLPIRVDADVVLLADSADPELLAEQYA
jgi:nitrite reductase/ring-hydroxylating ferredoxin subunit